MIYKIFNIFMAFIKTGDIDINNPTHARLLKDCGASLVGWQEGIPINAAFRIELILKVIAGKTN
jgi:hypothetical protein